MGRCREKTIKIYKIWVLRVMFIARVVTIAPWVADFVKEEGAVTADETDAQELFMHQPDEVSAGRCRALMWNAGGEKLKCGRKPLRGTEFCSRWETDSTPSGKMRGAIPASVMKLFREKALTPTRKSTQWYARHLRWAHALSSDITKTSANQRTTHATEKT